MKKHKQKKYRNAYHSAMMKRHTFSQKMRDRRNRRNKDARKSWRRDYEI